MMTAYNQGPSKDVIRTLISVIFVFALLLFCYNKGCAQHIQDIFDDYPQLDSLVLAQFDANNPNRPLYPFGQIGDDLFTISTTDANLGIIVVFDDVVDSIGSYIQSSNGALAYDVGFSWSTRFNRWVVFCASPGTIVCSNYCWPLDCRNSDRTTYYNYDGLGDTPPPPEQMNTIVIPGLIASQQLIVTNFLDDQGFGYMLIEEPFEVMIPSAAALTGSGSKLK